MLYGVRSKQKWENTIGEVRNDLVCRGVAAGNPAPKYGYLRRNEFYVGAIDGGLANDWVMYTLRGMIYTDRKGRNMGTAPFICQIPWGDLIRYVLVDGA